MATSIKGASAKTGRNVKVKIAKDVVYPSIYSNFLGVGATAFDISILFAEQDNSTSGDADAIPRVKVTIAPEQAANLMQLLGTILQQYVEASGKLRKGGLEIPTENS